MNGKLRFMMVMALIALGVMVTGCTAGAGEQASTLSEVSGSVAEGEAAAAAAGMHDDEADGHDDAHDGDEHEAEVLTLPALNAAELGGAPLRVAATTSIIGDVVTQVGGGAIDLTVLIKPGQDPHSYQPAARDLTAVANAHVIFVNGWNLEERLTRDLETIGGDALVVPISANIQPLAFAEGDDEHEEDEHDHSGADPHIWFSIHNVEQWVENVVHVLRDLDPANAAEYERNAAAYLAELAELEEYAETQLSQIPPENRFLVTNHDALGYFAHEYGFTVVGTVIPSMSTMSEPSARDLADLIAAMKEHNICTIFTENTLNDTLAQTVAGELSACDGVQVLKLYTDAIGPEGSGEDSYTGMFRANVDAIVTGLR